MPVAGSNRKKLIAALLLFAAGPLCGAAALDALSGGRVRNGSYMWKGAADGPMRIVVSRTRQRAYVYSGGELIAVSSVSTGKPGHRTPIGEFTILQKQVRHRSNKYSNAPMPFMQRLTWDGVAMHAGRLPGYAASHGCIRLPWAFARRLFAATALGAIVEVTDGGPALPRVEMAAYKPPRPAAPPLALAAATVPAASAVAAPAAAVFIDAPAAHPAPVVIAVAPRPEIAVRPARVVLASAEIVRPPRASWRERSADDFVTWGSAFIGARAPSGTQ